MPYSRDSKNRELRGGVFRAGSRQRWGQPKLASKGFPAFSTFFAGQASALVEPVAAVPGAVLVTQVAWILPYALAFAAGAMMFLAIEELNPESQSHGNTDIATLSTILGFTVMMCLDVGLG
jgi:ZIP family zinc transporter